VSVGNLEASTRRPRPDLGYYAKKEEEEEDYDAGCNSTSYDNPHHVILSVTSSV
jgi:hypothetical protein